MFRSLNFRLLLSYLAVILVCLVLVGLGLLLFVRASPLWTRASFLQLEAATRATMPRLRRAGPLSSLPEESLHALLAQVAQEQEVRVLLLDETGRVLFDSGGAWEGQRLEETVRVPAVRGITRGVFTAPIGGRWAFVGQVMPAAASGEARHILLFASLQGRLLMLSWFAENLLPPLVRAGVVALVLSVLLALLISRSVSAPLRRVAGAAEAIARGETGVRAPVSGPAEVRALARSFNAMVARVGAAQRSQRDFVANVSHELKTPLTSIQGFSQALLDGTASTPDTMARAARVIHEEAERMQRMVDELLTLARFDAGRVVMAREPVALAPLLQVCVERLAPQAREADVTLTLEIPEGALVAGDADRLAQVFANLLDNAVAHTPAGGRVTLAARRVEEGPAVEVVVADTGEGIPTESLPRIFERFYQVDPARQRGRGAPSRACRGAGLGLAITKEIVEAHGGTIAVESAVGTGSEFTVRLPAWEGEGP